MARYDKSEQLDAIISAAFGNADARVPRAPADLAPLVRLAFELRNLPREDFKARLKTNLERSITMATAAVKPVPEGYRTLTPYLTVKEAPQLLDFLTGVFGAQLLHKSMGSAGGMHAEMVLGDSRIMVGGGAAYSGPFFPASIHLKVQNVDEMYERALEAGATSLHAPADFEYGERGASVSDLSGNHWYLATPKGQTHFLPEMGTVTPYLHPRGAGKLIDFLKEALEAEEIVRSQSPAGIIEHAKVRIGNSIVEMGEAHGQYEAMPMMFYVYVSDVDATYGRALQAGAKSISAPADQPYGDRSGAVEDLCGNHWYIATRIHDVAH